MRHVVTFSLSSCVYNYDSFLKDSELLVYITIMVALFLGYHYTCTDIVVLATQ